MKTTITTLFIISISTLFAQDYHITFTASGESSTIDSVFVENLTQCTRLTLPGSDTLHLVYSLHVDDLNSNNASSETLKNGTEPILLVKHTPARYYAKRRSMPRFMLSFA